MLEDSRDSEEALLAVDNIEAFGGVASRSNELFRELNYREDIKSIVSPAEDCICIFMTRLHKVYKCAV